MWWQDSSGTNYYSRRSREENYYPHFNKQQLIKEIKGTSGLTEYHKKQMTKAIKEGLGGYVEPGLRQFKQKKITAQSLIQDINKHLVEKEIGDDQIFFSSTDDFFARY